MSHLFPGRKLRPSFLFLLCIGILLVSCQSTVWAKFARPNLKQVPIDRLEENLKQAVQESPKDAQLRRNLARVHAMAYASKQAKVEVNNRDESLWFGYTPKFVPFEVQETKNAELQKKAAGKLKAAIEQYEAALKLDPDDLATKLGLAWALDQADQDDRAKELYQSVIELAWKKEDKYEHGRMGKNYLTAEAADYLIPLLDAEKDSVEIKTLKQRVAKLKALPTPITPIAIPLADDLTAEDIHDRCAKVRFDADGTGLLNRWTWLHDNAGWLVYDADGQGNINSARQMFGSASFMLFCEHGYDAMAALDDNRDGMLSGDELAKLAIWHDVNGNGRSETGEVRPLEAHGIVSLSCRYQRQGDQWWSPAGVKYRNGGTRPSFDLVLQPQE